MVADRGPGLSSADGHLSNCISHSIRRQLDPTSHLSWASGQTESYFEQRRVNIVTVIRTNVANVTQILLQHLVAGEKYHDDKYPLSPGRLSNTHLQNMSSSLL